MIKHRTFDRPDSLVFGFVSLSGSKHITHRFAFRLRTFMSSRPVGTSCCRQVCALICGGNTTEQLRLIHFSFPSIERDGHLRTSVLSAFRRTTIHPSHFLSFRFLCTTEPRHSNTSTRNVRSGVAELRDTADASRVLLRADT
jgi:hypothetical protein